MSPASSPARAALAHALPALAGARLLLALLAALSVGGAARADWAQTFEPAALASYLDGKPAVLVAGAGTRTASLTAAAKALRGALQAKGASDLVMDDKSLGNLADLDDAAIVKKCHALPIALVAIVRVFDAAEGPSSAVVTFYDQPGAVRFALAGKDGTAIARQSQAASGGASAAATKSVAETTMRMNGADPVSEEYEAKQIYFQDFVTVGMNQYGTVVSRYDWSQAYQGPERRPLSGAEFFDAVGHPELATKYRDVASRNHVIGVTCAIAAGAILVTGIVLMTQDEVGAGLIVALAGPLVPAIVYGVAAQNPNPVDGPGQRKLVNEYDHALRDRLHMPAHSAEGEPEKTLADNTPAESVRFNFGAAPLRHGAGVAFGLTF